MSEDTQSTQLEAMLTETVTEPTEPTVSEPTSEPTSEPASEPASEPVSQPESQSTEIKVNPERAPGSTAFPVARIKRLIKEDKDIAMISSEATFCIAVATELFLEHFIKESHMNVKKDKRKTVFYRDMADVVQDNASFEFLSDVIPSTMTLKAAVEKRKRALNDDSPLKKQKVITTNATKDQEMTETIQENAEK